MSGTLKEAGATNMRQRVFHEWPQGLGGEVPLAAAGTGMKEGHPVCGHRFKLMLIIDPAEE